MQIAVNYDLLIIDIGDLFIFVGILVYSIYIGMSIYIPF